MPQKPASSSSAHQIRWVIHGGIAQDVAEREERAVREEVAVGLVLHLAQRGLAAPLVRGALQESDRILGEVVLGVGDEPAGGLEKGEKKRYDRGAEQPPPDRGSAEGAMDDMAADSGEVRELASRRSQRLPYSTWFSSEESALPLRSIVGTRVVLCGCGDAETSPRRRGRHRPRR